MRFMIPVAAATALAAAVPTAVAQDADTREVLAYRLSMPKLRQLNEVMADLQRQMEADPAYQALQRKKRELAALAEKDELTEAEQERMAKLEEEIAAAEEAEEEEDVGGEDQSLTALAARMEADQRIAAALRRGGLSAREAATIQFALLQAALAAELMESGGVKEVPKDVSAENVRFYQANKAAIQALSGLRFGEQEQ
jgi:hypothetical protein